MLTVCMYASMFVLTIVPNKMDNSDGFLPILDLKYINLTGKYKLNWKKI